MTEARAGAVAAVDLGATSGRVMVGHVASGDVVLEPVARFANGPVAGPDGWRWDFTGLFEQIVRGLAQAVRVEPALASVGVDAWAVDYGLIRDGALLSEPFHYRDERTARGVAAVHREVPFPELYRRNGLQHLPFTTIYQYAAEHRLYEAQFSLLIPDLVTYLLTGVAVAERTNASTTGLLSVRTREWDSTLAERLGIPKSALAPLTDPGATVGTVRAPVAERIGASLEVIAVGSHDTASAVVAVPLSSPDAAFISCGTWGLVGVERERPILTDAAREANFTNEGGVDGRIRFLRNVAGLWLLSETIRSWEADDAASVDLGALLGEAARLDTPPALFDANEPSLSAPGDMPGRIAALLRAQSDRVPEGRAAFARVILESIASAFADAVHTTARLTDRPIDVIHLVGGGALNTLLCQLTADRAGLPVLAGPVEATALGNVLVQARAHGWFGADASLETLRAAVARSYPPVRYDPRR